MKNLRRHCFLVFLFTRFEFMVIAEFNQSMLPDLQPYQERHGSRLSHREIRSCQPLEYGNSTHEVYSSVINASSIRPNAINVQMFAMQVGSRLIKGHVAFVEDPARRVSVLEPSKNGGCGEKLRATVGTTATNRKNCKVAMNAGFFNTTTGNCLGNVVSDGRIVADSRGIQNAHFGITRDGKLFFGYLAESELKTGNVSNFQQLVGGVIWLLRNGTSYVEQSKIAECSSSQETGDFDRFVNVRSARTAIGHNENGGLILVQVEGKTDQEGANLNDMATILKKLGAVNAINTDGGGSATFIVNGNVVNYPSDDCVGNANFKCERKVSTVICAHEPEPECAGFCKHGICLDGECRCDQPWEGSQCDQLPCGQHNCSGNGMCTEYGCVCETGWSGNACHLNTTNCLFHTSPGSQPNANSHLKLVVIIMAIMTVISTGTCIVLSIKQCKQKWLKTNRKQSSHQRTILSTSSSSDEDEEAVVFLKRPR